VIVQPAHICHQTDTDYFFACAIGRGGTTCQRKTKRRQQKTDGDGLDVVAKREFHVL
jgi:hypothetical protein